MPPPIVTSIAMSPRMRGVAFEHSSPPHSPRAAQVSRLSQHRLALESALARHYAALDTDSAAADPDIAVGMAVLSASAPVAFSPRKLHIDSSNSSSPVAVAKLDAGELAAARAKLATALKEIAPPTPGSGDSEEIRRARSAVFAADEVLTMSHLQHSLPKSFRTARSSFSAFLAMVAHHQRTGENTIADLRAKWSAAERGHDQFLAESHYFQRVPVVALYMRQFDFVRKCVLQAKMDRSAFVPTGLLYALFGQPENGEFGTAGDASAEHSIYHAPAADPHTPEKSKHTIGVTVTKSPQNKQQQQQGSEPERRVSFSAAESNNTAAPAGQFLARPAEAQRRASVVTLEGWIAKSEGYIDEFSKDLADLELTVRNVLEELGEVNQAIDASPQANEIWANADVVWAQNQTEAQRVALERLYEDEKHAISQKNHLKQGGSSAELRTAAESVHDVVFLRSKRIAELRNYRTWILNEISTKSAILQGESDPSALSENEGEEEEEEEAQAEAEAEAEAEEEARQEEEDALVEPIEDIDTKIAFMTNSLQRLERERIAKELLEAKIAENKARFAKPAAEPAEEEPENEKNEDEDRQDKIEQMRQSLSRLEKEQMMRENLERLNHSAETRDADNAASFDKENRMRESLARLEKEEKMRHNLATLEKIAAMKENLARLEQENQMRVNVAVIEDSNQQILGSGGDVETIKMAEDVLREEIHELKLEKIDMMKENLARLEKEEQMRHNLATLEKIAAMKENLARLEKEEQEGEEKKDEA